jgi:hypothetical protein
MQPYTGLIIERKWFRKSSVGDDYLDNRNECDIHSDSSCPKIYISMMDSGLTFPAAPLWTGKWYYLEDTDPYIITHAEVLAGTYPRNFKNIPCAGTMFTSGIFVSSDNTKWRYFVHGFYLRLPKDGAVERTLPGFITPPNHANGYLPGYYGINYVG